MITKWLNICNYQQVNCSTISSNPTITFNIGGKPFALTPKQNFLQMVININTICDSSYFSFSFEIKAELRACLL